MNEQELQEMLQTIIEESESPDIVKVSTFAESMLMTRDSGLIVRMEDGSEFQIIIVQYK